MAATRVVLTLDAVCWDHREKMSHLVANLPNVSRSAYQSSATTVDTLSIMLDFFRDLAEGDAAVHVYPLELARETEFLDLERRLGRALIRKLGTPFVHVAIGVAGDAHESFDSDIAAGRRTTSTLKDAHERSAMLGTRAAFERVAKTFSSAPRIAWASDYRRIDLDDVLMS
jgi:hypothetical protein